MKYLILALFLVPLTANGQFTIGDKLVGGTFSLVIQGSPENQNNSHLSKGTYFKINPQMGFFLNEKIALGGSIGYSVSNQKFKHLHGATSYSDSYSISVGFFVRRYFQISDNFFILLDGNPYYQHNSYENPSNSDLKGYSIGLSVKPVLSFFPSKNWGFEASFGEIAFEHTDAFDQKINYFGLGLGSFNFGLTYYLYREKE